MEAECDAFNLSHSADPRQWTEGHVREWLLWTVNEFSLKNVDFFKFSMNGASLCALGKDRFLDLAPDFVGDILWEHLEMLQKGKTGDLRSAQRNISYLCGTRHRP